MNTISFNLGFILFFALIVWVFLANNLYLKIFFLKSKKKKRKNESSDSEIFEQAYGGDTIPQYIKDAILKSQDKYELLSLYLASRSLINTKIYNCFMRDISTNIELEFENIVKHRFNGVYGFFKIFRIFFIVLIYLFFIYFIYRTCGGFNVDYKISYFILIFSMVSLMPYDFFINNRFFNMVSRLSVYLVSVIFAMVNVYFVYSVFPKTEFYVISTINMIIVLFGAYSCLNYEKFNYMCNFFELLKINLEQNRIDTASDITTPTTHSTTS